MNSEGFKQRFVEWGGWVKRTRLVKRKAAFVWGLAAVWFGGFAAVFSSFAEIGAALWSLAWIGQVVLAVTAIVVSCLEKPVAETELIRNLEKKPECLY